MMLRALLYAVLTLLYHLTLRSLALLERSLRSKPSLAAENLFLRKHQATVRQNSNSMKVDELVRLVARRREHGSTDWDITEMRF